VLVTFGVYTTIVARHLEVAPESAKK